MATLTQNNRSNLIEFMKLCENLRRDYKGINPFWQQITENTRFTGVGLKTTILRLNQMPKTDYLTLKQSWFRELTDKFRVGSLLKAIQANRVFETYKGNKGNLELAYAIEALQHLGIWEDAYAFLKAHHFRLNYVSLRHYSYLHRLTALLSGNQGVRVLEIGAGGGMLRSFLKKRLGPQITHYTIVDLPEMLCLSAYSGMEFFPEETHAFMTEGSSKLSAKNRYVPALLAGQATSLGPFDLFLNTHSFQEMDKAVIADYFALIYKSAAPGALFLNANWHQPKMTRLDGSEWNNDPRKFPYQEGDEVLFEDEDPFHGYLLKKYGYKANLDVRQLSVRRIQANSETPSASAAR